MGSVLVQPDGTIPVDGGGAIGPVSASVKGIGTLDATHNVMYDVTLHMTYNLGDGERPGESSSRWFRWDPETETFPALE